MRPIPVEKGKVNFVLGRIDECDIDMLEVFCWGVVDCRFGADGKA
jgi:hypothetical protein